MKKVETRGRKAYSPELKQLLFSMRLIQEELQISEVEALKLAIKIVERLENGK